MEITLEHFKNYIIKIHKSYTDRTSESHSRKWVYGEDSIAISYIETTEDSYEYYKHTEKKMPKFLIQFERYEQFNSGMVSFELDTLNDPNDIKDIFDSFNEYGMKECSELFRFILKQAESMALESELQKELQGNLAEKSPKVKI
jgi:hypothetical protein